MNKFEQLIEYVINDDTQKAQELFHEIVVEKSRQIYEDLMEEEIEEGAEEMEEGTEEIEEGAEEMEEGTEEMEEAFGGDASKKLIQDVEVEEEGMYEEEEEEVDFSMDDEGQGEMGDDKEHDGDLEDRVIDLEDKLDELMAEFEDMMGSEGGQDDMEIELDAGEGGDALAMDDTAEFQDEEMMSENVSLKAAPKPVTSEEGGINKKSTVAANAGARGAIAKPVHAGGEGGGKHDTSAYSNTTKDLISKVGNSPAQSTQNPSAAPKPHLSQATGVNTRSPVAKS